ncbi:CT194-like protein [Mya arenaria]|uniref:CT194-like protein n=1 Tax=Mya arenaria TaxID=6604 RepID=A0ABY7FGQ8_MYAAR|nr:CT194-like protein [Mya arenaria]
MHTFTVLLQYQQAIHIVYFISRLLTVLYGAMVDAVLAGIQAYSSTLGIKQAADAALEIFAAVCSEVKDDAVVQFLKGKPNITFSMVATDSHGIPVTLAEGKKSLLVKTTSLTISDIPSPDTPGTLLGSLVFSETFLDSQIQVLQKDGSLRLDGTYLLLTDHVPRYRAWAVTSLVDERKCLQQKLEGPSLKENFGDLLLSGDPIHLGCSRTHCLPPEEAILYAFENGLVILCPQYGAVALHGNHIRSAQFYDGDTSNTVAVLVLEYQSTFLPFLPFHLQNEECQLILMFTPKSKAYKHLYSDVLHTWRKDEDSPKVKRIDQLPDNCSLMHALLQHEYMELSMGKVKTALQKASSGLPHLYRFLEHFSLGSLGWLPVPETDLGAVLGRAGGQVVDTEAEIVVTILSGVPGSHQQDMCDILTSMSKEQNRYVVWKPVIDGRQQFSPVDIQAKLKATLNVHRRRKQGKMATRNTRVIYVVPGYTDIVSVVQAIECHPDPDVRSHCAIGSVTACVDPLNVFMEHHFTLPYLLNTCAQGWVNQIVMTSSTTLQNEDLETIQHMLRSVNPDVAFLLAEQGNVSRSMDVDAILSEESWRSLEKVRARYLLVPSWRRAGNQSTPVMGTVQLNFTLPLDKHKLVNKLRGLKSHQGSFPFVGNIYNVHGKLRFTDSKPSECMELRYTTLSGQLVISPYTETAREKTQAPGNTIVFTGCGLTPDKLKDWLRDCAPPKPEKKPLISRKDVSRDVINKIHKTHHLEVLPEGWFYNGTQYVSFDGTKQDKHPGLEEFVRGYLEEKNADIKAHNAQVEEQLASYMDLFS